MEGGDDMSGGILQVATIIEGEFAGHLTDGIIGGGGHGTKY